MDRHEEISNSWELPPRKRVRLDSDDTVTDEVEAARKHRKYHEPLAEKHDHVKSPTSNPQVVGPFMVKHIPAQYNPQGAQGSSTRPNSNGANQSNTKFCYRHRPDMLCRRQADEPTMDKLQRNLEKLSENDRQAVVQVWSLFSAAPSKYRNLMLQGILTQCCFPQLSFLSTNVQKLIKIDFLSALPPEISFRILSSLDTISLCKAAQVSRKWRTLADDDVVWHRMCEQHIDRKCIKCGWGLPLLDRKRLRASKRQMQLRAAGKGLNVWSPASTPMAEVEQDPMARASQASSSSQLISKVVKKEAVTSEPSVQDTVTKRPWKDVYRDRFRVGKNWKRGVCSTKVLKGHSNGVMACQIYDNILATGSYDTTIKIWDLNTGKELRTIEGHANNPNGHRDGIRCLQMDECKLISGGMDTTIRIWNWRTGEHLATHRGHHASVIGLHYDSEADILVSGSADHTAKIWDFRQKTVCTLNGHQNWVNSVKIDTASRTIFTASDDFTAKLWDMDTKRCIRTFEKHTAMIQQIALLPPGFDAEDDVTLVDDTSAPGSPESHHTVASSTFTSQESPELSFRPLPLQRQVSDAYSDTFVDGRPEPPRYMVTSALDNTIRMWDVSTGRCIRTFFGHIEGVWALAVDTLRIVSGANDKLLKVWDPRTGKCEGTFSGHAGPVNCVALSDSRMVSGGEDNEVRVYCFSDASDTAS